MVAAPHPEEPAPITPPESMLHAFRDSAKRAPDATGLTYFDATMTYRQVDEL